MSKDSDSKYSNPTGYRGDAVLLLNACQKSCYAGYRILFSLLLLSTNCVRALSECTPPKGSYQDTCTVTGKIYISSDPNLRSVAMCQFDLACKKLNGSSERTTFYVQNSMSSCLQFFENCNGNPVIRKNNERICITTEASKRESGIAMEL